MCANIDQSVRIWFSDETPLIFQRLFLFLVSCFWILITGLIKSSKQIKWAAPLLSSVTASTQYQKSTKLKHKVIHFDSLNIRMFDILFWIFGCCFIASVGRLFSFCLNFEFPLHLMQPVYGLSKETIIPAYVPMWTERWTLNAKHYEKFRNYVDFGPTTSHISNHYYISQLLYRTAHSYVARI